MLRIFLKLLEILLGTLIQTAVIIRFNKKKKKNLERCSAVLFFFDSLGSFNVISDPLESFFNVSSSVLRDLKIPKLSNVLLA